MKTFKRKAFEQFYIAFRKINIGEKKIQVITFSAYLLAILQINVKGSTLNRSQQFTVLNYFDEA